MELLRRLLTPYLLARNALDYPLRRLIRPRRVISGIEPVGLEAALTELAAADAERGRELVGRYGLERLAQRGRRRDVLQNLYYLELLAQALERADAVLPERLVAIDVGAGDWFYAPALGAALERWQAIAPRKVELLGFETDPGRLYADGYSRENWAAWHTQDLPNARYVADDARGWRGEADLATMLFPFLFARDHDDWGLPRHLLRPGELLRHVWHILRPGGILIVANQGERERDEQRRLFEAAKIPAIAELFESPFWSYDLPRCVHVACKPG